MTLIHKQIASQGNLYQQAQAASGSEDFRPSILFVSMCVPNPPEKGEKIRSFHLIHHLSKQYRVHLVCFARNDSEVAAAHALEHICSSVYVEKLSSVTAVIRGGVRLTFGGCLNAGYYWSPRMKQYVDNPDGALGCAGDAGFRGRHDALRTQAYSGFAGHAGCGLREVVRIRGQSPTGITVWPSYFPT